MAKKPKILSCSENSRNFKVLIPSDWHGQKIHIDGEVITEQNTKKCDYAFKVLDEVKTRYALIYVELKGDDLAQAISQLEDTIKYFQHNTEYLAFAKQYARVVCSKISPFTNSNLQVRKKTFKEKYKFDLAWQSREGSLTFTSNKD
ncbi:MAG TPA: hypothetical protein PKC11_13440 [Agitococcus sp.]|nr:hypothetical protein [Agitococcus sp.]